MVIEVPLLILCELAGHVRTLRSICRHLPCPGGAANACRSYNEPPDAAGGGRFATSPAMARSLLLINLNLARIPRVFDIREAKIGSRGQNRTLVEFDLSTVATHLNLNRTLLGAI